MIINKIVFSIIFISLIISGCNTPKSKEVKVKTSVKTPPSIAYGDALIVGGTRDAITLNPILAADGPSHVMCGMIFDGLVQYDGDMKLIGNLAQSWEVSEDGLNVLFHLRHDVKWHDGYPFTAKDVLFTYEAATDPRNRSLYAPSLAMVENIRALDDYTVSVRYSSSYTGNISAFSFGILPRHLLFDENPIADAQNFNIKPIGTGPFRFSEWKPDELISLNAYEAYHHGRPYIDRYVYKIIPDSSVLYLELTAGRIDMMSLSEEHLRRLKTEKAGERFNIFKYPGRGYMYMGYKLDNPLFSNSNVRLALTHAIDRQNIIDGILEGMGSICTGPFYPGSWAYNNDVIPFKYDPEKAAELLDEAGWSLGPDGIRVNDEGLKMSFKICVDSSKRDRNVAAVFIQESLRKIGVNAEIERLSHNEMVNEKLLRGNFESFIAGWDLPVDPDIFDIWHSSRRNKGLNFIGYSNPQVDELLEEARITFEQETRKAMYRSVHRLIHDDQPVNFLFVQDTMIALSKRFKDVEVKPMGLFHNFIRWYVPKNDQRY